MTEGTRRSLSFIEPMKALPVEKLPEGDWPYEIKFDGYRSLAFKDGKDARLVSHNQKEFNYPQLLDALKLLPAERVTLDGKIAALDEKGRCLGRSKTILTTSNGPSDAGRLLPSTDSRVSAR
jgi:ATP-dependent DNA ligase